MPLYDDPATEYVEFHSVGRFTTFPQSGQTGIRM